MDKTAMQELIDSLVHQSNGCTRDTRGSERYILSGIIDFAKQLLEKEKQQIIEAYNQGYRDGETTGVTIDKKDVSKCADAKIYFTETYNTQQV